MFSFIFVELGVQFLNQSKRMIVGIAKLCSRVAIPFCISMTLVAWHLQQHLVWSALFILAILVMTNDVDHLFMCLAFMASSHFSY